MTNDDYVPTQAEIWDFLVGLKETTESGFERMESRFAGVDARFSGVQADIEKLQSAVLRIERRLVRMDRLSEFENLNIRSRIEDHEQRITRLEQQT